MDFVDGGPWRGPTDPGPQNQNTYTAGTYTRHPLSLAAAHAILSELIRQGPSLQQGLNQRADELANVLNTHFKQCGIPLRMQNFGSFFRFAHEGNLSFVYPPLALELFVKSMINRGIYIWEGGTCFLSTAHSDSDLNQIVDAAESSVAELLQGGYWANSVNKSTHRESAWSTVA